MPTEENTFGSQLATLRELLGVQELPLIYAGEPLAAPVTVSPDQLRTVVTDDHVLHTPGGRCMANDVAIMEGRDIVVLTEAQFQQLRKDSKAAFAHAQKLAGAVMNRKRAAIVRALRISDHGSWRYIAFGCRAAWQRGWLPPDNQAIGMALCEHAARMFGEDYREAPWN